jgi:hypothetical protein
VATGVRTASQLSLHHDSVLCDISLLAGVQDCNLVLYSSGGTAPADAIYSSGTYNQGATPCQLTISSAGGGFFAVSDSKFAQLYYAPSPALVRQPSPCAVTCCIKPSLGVQLPCLRLHACCGSCRRLYELEETVHHSALTAVMRKKALHAKARVRRHACCCACRSSSTATPPVGQ